MDSVLAVSAACVSIALPGLLSGLLQRAGSSATTRLQQGCSWGCRTLRPGFEAVTNCQFANPAWGLCGLLVVSTSKDIPPDD